MRAALIFFWYLCCASLTYAAYIPDNELDNLSLLIDSLPLSFISNNPFTEQPIVFAFLCTVDKRTLGIIPADSDKCMISGREGVMESGSFSYLFRSRNSLFRFYSSYRKNQTDPTSWYFRDARLCYQPLEGGTKLCLLPSSQKKLIKRELDELYSGSGSGSDEGELPDDSVTESTKQPPTEEDPYYTLKVIGITVSALLAIITVYGVIQYARDRAYKKRYTI